MYEPHSTFNGSDLLIEIDGKVIAEAQQIECDEENERVTITIVLYSTIVNIDQHMQNAKVVEEYYSNEYGQKLYRLIEIEEFLGKKSIIKAGTTTGTILYNYKLKEASSFKKPHTKIEKEEMQDEPRN